MKRSTFPNLFIAGILTIVLILLTGMLATINGQTQARIQISDNEIVVTVQFAPDVKEYKKAVKLVVNKGIISRKISEVTIMGNTYRVVPVLDGSITYNLYINGQYDYKSTKIADIRKRVITISLIIRD